MDILNDFQAKAHISNLSADKATNGKIIKGRILRVKPGYNPNSSSMGSIVYSLPQIMLGLTAIFGLVSGIIISRFAKNHEQPADKIQKSEDKV